MNNTAATTETPEARLARLLNERGVECTPAVRAQLAAEVEALVAGAFAR